MNQASRGFEILQALGQSGSARISELARRLGVSEETVRRNLRPLVAQGRVVRVHGGVHLAEWSAEPSFARRMAENPVRKRRIARAVAAMIPDAASLFLDVGSTTAHVAQALRGHRSLMVVTNSLAVAQALVGNGGNRVFMAGGALRAHDGGAFGAEALAFVRQFRVDFAVLSAAAVTAEAGFLLHDLREAEFSRAILERAGHSLMAVDATKFGRQAPIRLAPPGAIGTLVTDAPPPTAIAGALSGAGVRILLARGAGTGAGTAAYGDGSGPPGPPRGA